MPLKPFQLALLSMTLSCANLACAASESGVPGGGDEQPLISFGDAVDDWHDVNYQRALRAFSALAEAGDSRSQLLLSTVLVEGKRLPRDLPQAYAWAYVAAAEDVYAFGSSARPMAQKVKADLEARLSGADLIRGERVAQTYLAAHEADFRQRLAAAREVFTDSASHPGIEVRPGCALKPDMIVCTGLRKDLAQGPRCQGPLAKSSKDNGAMPRLARVREPAYPKTAVMHAWEGVFVFAAHVDRNGYVCRIAVIKGSGYRAIDDTVLAILPSWRFEPEMEDGQPVEGVTAARIEHAITDYQMDSGRR